MSTLAVRRAAGEVLAALVNVVVFLGAFWLALWVVYPALVALLRFGSATAAFDAQAFFGFNLLVVAVILAFMFGGALVRVWTPSALNVFIVSAGVFLFCVLLLAQAMFLTDGGDPEAVWRLTRPGLPELVGALLAAGGSCLGWYSVSRLRVLHRGRAATQ